jgi:hypothetical protein
MRETRTPPTSMIGIEVCQLSSHACMSPDIKHVVFACVCDSLPQERAPSLSPLSCIWCNHDTRSESKDIPRTCAGAVGPEIGIAGAGAGADQGASKQKRMHDEASDSSADTDVVKGAKKVEDDGKDEEGQVQSLLERSENAVNLLIKLLDRSWTHDAMHVWQRIHTAHHAGTHFDCNSARGCLAELPCIRLRFKLFYDC